MMPAHVRLEDDELGMESFELNETGTAPQTFEAQSSSPFQQICHFTTLRKKELVILFGAIFALALILFAFSVSRGSQTSDASSSGSLTPFQTEFYKNLSTIMSSRIDDSQDPCEDFYQYACGDWLDSITLPPELSRVSLSFTSIFLRNQEILQEIVNEEWPLISAHYESCMNEEAIEKLAETPLNNLFTKIDHLKQNGSLSYHFELLGEIHSYGVYPMFGFSVSASLVDSNLSIGYIDQGGFILPKDYYFATSQEGMDLLQGYRQYIQSVLNLLRFPLSDQASLADQILNLERELAQFAWSPDEFRENLDIYSNPMTQIELESVTDQDWDPYFNVFRNSKTKKSVRKADPDTSSKEDYRDFYEKRIDHQSRIKPEIVEKSIVMNPSTTIYNVGNLDFVQNMIEVLEGKSEPGVIAYLKYFIAHSTSPLLSKAFRDNLANFNQMITGSGGQADREDQCIESVDGVFGELLGHYFVMKTFSENSKIQAQHILTQLRTSFAQMLHNPQEVNWMTESTKQLALQKLNAIIAKIGYPDVWNLYFDISVSLDQYFNSTMEAMKLFNLDQISTIGQPVDKTTWGMNPQTVNAYYNPTVNEVVFPASILQPPFFHIFFPTAVNYAGIGSVMGHELTHGFDDEGRQFDKDGNMKQWWSQQDITNFEERAQCVVDFYNQYEVAGTHVNGRLTEGENIADMGGVKEAYYGFLNELKYTHQSESQKKEIESIFKMTQDQLFFVSYAQIWCTKYRDEYLQYLMTVNPHSPAQFRVNGPLSNFPVFSESFQCSSGSKMNIPSDKVCSVW